MSTSQPKKIENYNDLAKEYFKDVDIMQFINNYNFKSPVTEIEPMEPINFPKEPQTSSYHQIYKNPNYPPGGVKEFRLNTAPNQQSDEFQNGSGSVNKNINPPNINIPIENNKKYNIRTNNYMQTSLDREKEQNRRDEKKRQMEYQNFLDQQIKEKEMKKKLEKEKRMKEELLYEEKLRQEQEELLKLEQQQLQAKKENNFFNTNYPMNPKKEQDENKIRGSNSSSKVIQRNDSYGFINANMENIPHTMTRNKSGIDFNNADFNSEMNEYEGDAMINNYMSNPPSGNPKKNNTLRRNNSINFTQQNQQNFLNIDGLNPEMNNNQQQNFQPPMPSIDNLVSTSTNINQSYQGFKTQNNYYPNNNNNTFLHNTQNNPYIQQQLNSIQQQLNQIHLNQNLQNMNTMQTQVADNIPTNSSMSPPMNPGIQTVYQVPFNRLVTSSPGLNFVNNSQMNPFYNASNNFAQMNNNSQNVNEMMNLNNTYFGRMFELFFNEQAKIIESYKETIEQLKNERDEALFRNKENEEKIKFLERNTKEQSEKNIPIAPFENNNKTAKCKVENLRPTEEADASNDLDANFEKVNYQNKKLNDKNKNIKNVDNNTLTNNASKTNNINNDNSNNVDNNTLNNNHYKKNPYSHSSQIIDDKMKNINNFKKKTNKQPSNMNNDENLINDDSIQVIEIPIKNCKINLNDNFNKLYEQNGENKKKQNIFNPSTLISKHQIENSNINTNPNMQFNESNSHKNGSSNYSESKASLLAETKFVKTNNIGTLETWENEEDKKFMDTGLVMKKITQINQKILEPPGEVQPYLHELSVIKKSNDEHSFNDDLKDDNDFKIEINDNVNPKELQDSTYRDVNKITFDDNNFTNYEESNKKKKPEAPMPNNVNNAQLQNLDNNVSYSTQFEINKNNIKNGDANLYERRIIETENEDLVNSESNKKPINNVRKFPVTASQNRTNLNHNENYMNGGANKLDTSEEVLTKMNFFEDDHEEKFQLERKNTNVKEILRESESFMGGVMIENNQNNDDEECNLTIKEKDNYRPPSDLTEKNKKGLNDFYGQFKKKKDEGNVNVSIGHESLLNESLNTFTQNLNMNWKDMTKRDNVHDEERGGDDKIFEKINQFTKVAHDELGQSQLSCFNKEKTIKGNDYNKYN